MQDPQRQTRRQKLGGWWLAPEERWLITLVGVLGVASLIALCLMIASR